MPYDAIDYNGDFVEVADDVAHVVKEVQRLWPELTVQYVENPDLGQAPYRVVERRNGLEMPVMSVWELDNRLLEQLYQADTHRHGVKILDKLDADNNKIKIAQAKEFANWHEVFKDMLVTMSHHIGSSWTFKDPRPGHEGEIVKVEDS